jgi:hypothetical protein
VSQFVDDDLHQQALVGENGEQPLDHLEQLGELVEDLLRSRPVRPLQLHVEEGLRLDLTESELRDQASGLLPDLFAARMSAITASM